VKKQIKIKIKIVEEEEEEGKVLQTHLKTKLNNNKKSVTLLVPNSQHNTKILFRSASL